MSSRRAVWLLGLVLAACSASPSPVAPSAGVPSTAPADATLRVLVTTAGGAKLPGARVCASTPRSEERCADASDSGTATMTVAPGVYFVRVSGPARGGRWADERRVADLARGDAALWVELAVRHRISGTVRDTAGQAVAGAVACAHPASDDPAVCEKSGVDGTYAIDVNAGAYRVEVGGPPVGRLVGQWAVGRVFLEEANTYDARTEDVAGVDVALAPGVVLRGTIRFAGAPVENAQVCLRTLAAPLPWDCERTDRNGRYAALREPGRYWVWVVPPDDLRAVPLWYDDVLEGFDATAFELGADASLDVSLRAAPSLHVIQGTVRTQSGSPVAGALVCVDTPFTTGRICRETASNGRYRIATRPESYVVSVLPPAHSAFITEYFAEKRTWNEADLVTLGDRDVTLDLVLRAGTIVAGVVRDARGIPVAGATLNFADARSVAAAVDTDVAGRFEAVMLPGRFHVQVFAPRSRDLVGQELEVDVPVVRDLDIALGDSDVP